MKRLLEAGLPSEVSSLKKKMKSSDDGERIISDLNSDEWSHVVEYLEIGEVIMLSLVNQSIHQIISDHIRTIHPYCLDDEWSISRALLNHRSAKITNDNIERVQHIANQLIEKNEPLTKFTKRFILKDAFDQAPKLFSSRQIGFGLEQLEIKSRTFLSTSILFKILAQCPNLTHFVIDNVLESKDDIDYIPVLNSLKSIRMVSHDNIDDNDGNGTFAALEIHLLAPNLEYLEFKYHNALDGKFLALLANMCPKLKGVHIETCLDYVGNYFKDDQVFKFLQNEPHLEYIHIDGCARINGSIYSKMGQFKQLKYFNVERKSYFNGDYVANQCDAEPFKGDGVLPHLQYLNIGPKMKGVNVDHLLKMAPNVKNVGCSLFKSTRNYMDIVDKSSNRLTTIPPMKLEGKSNIKYFQKWLEKTTALESLNLKGRASGIDFSKLEPIPTVKELELQACYSGDLLKEVFRVFPCVEIFRNHYILKAESKNTFIELIKEGKWPNLKQVLYRSDAPTNLRPHITWELQDEPVGSDEPFEKTWLQWDPTVIALKTQSDMERFFTNGTFRK